MQLKYRRFFYKIRFIHQLLRFMLYNSDYMLYRKLNKKYDYKSIYKSIKDSKKGKRCFIIGNGPSLTIEDINQLKDEDCFASNCIYLLFDKTKWRPKFYAVVDGYMKMSNSDIKSIIDIENVFIGSYQWKRNKKTWENEEKNIVCIRTHQMLNSKKCGFSFDIEKKTYVTATVSYVLMQIAVYAGYSEIYLLGFDNNYLYSVNKKGEIIKTDMSSNSSYFYSDYDALDTIADIDGMELSYKKMKEIAEKKNIIIKNATRGGKLEVFERVDFDDIIKDFKTEV